MRTEFMDKTRMIAGLLIVAKAAIESITSHCEHDFMQGELLDGAAATLDQCITLTREVHDTADFKLREVTK